MTKNKDNYRNTSSSQGKGNPSDTGQDKAEVKDTKEMNDQNLEENQELKEKYTDGAGQPANEKTKVTNINRNTEKEDIDKGRYN